MKIVNIDWRKHSAETDEDPDDELLPITPPDVIHVLGFDPLDFVEEVLQS